MAAFLVMKARKGKNELIQSENKRILLLFVAKEGFHTEPLCEKSVVLVFRVSVMMKADGCKHLFWLFLGILAISVKIII